MILVISLCSFLSLNASSQDLLVEGLVCEYRNNPIGIDVSHPRLSWKLDSKEQNVLQSAYELRVGANGKKLTKGKDILWQTGKINTNQSIHVAYAGPDLKSRQRYYWQVRVWDNHGHSSLWSEVKFWEMGLLQVSDWSAKWIQTNILTEGKAGPCPRFRKSFKLAKPIKSARLYITADGIYEAKLNGHRVGNDYFRPGWTSYHKRLQYQTYDVTDLLKKDENAVGITLGDGWYRGNLTWAHQRNIYGKEVALLFQLEVEYTDGGKEILGSDENWKSSINGPIRASDIYNGETYDARLENEGWTLYNFNDREWMDVKVINNKTENLVAPVAPPVRKQEHFNPSEILKSPKGETVIDFGQNMTGWVQLRVSGNAGDTVLMKFAEVLDKNGNFYTENLRSAKQEIKYILKGGGEEIYEPHFTFQGFRYVKVEGYPGKLSSSSLTAVALYSDMKHTGTFVTSNSALNQLQHNIQWGQKGNFLDIPTDCPQRDERLGWTGDAEVFFNTAAFNMQVAGFFTKWLKDLSADQHKDGNVPVVIPDVLSDISAGSAGWSDAATIIPWNFYLAYSDTSLLREQYGSMKAWVNYIQQNSHGYLWNTGEHFGDWLFYSPADDRDGRAAITDKYLIAQTFYAHSTQLLINAAEVLGKKQDVEKYTTLLKKIKEAFVKEYLTPNGRLVSGTQTAYVLALKFNMLPVTLREQAIERLVKNIKSYEDHLTTGFLGTPNLCPVLSQFGHTDVAYKLLLQETYPSWLYPVKMGATTIWERWDGIKPDSTFQNPGMNSFNHYAYGAIGHWMYSVIAGINPDESAPGYKKIIIAPKPGGNLTSARGELQTLYGKITSAWDIKNNLFMLNVTIPPNTTAKVLLPQASCVQVTDGKEGRTLDKLTTVGNDVQLSIGSGSYHFVYRWQ